MGKLLTKLSKNKNKTNISLYQIYLTKLHEKILKHNRLNLFKEIAVVFHHGLQTNSDSPISLSYGHLV